MVFIKLVISEGADMRSRVAQLPPVVPLFALDVSIDQISL